ncbi:MAG: type II CRISPR RNA-guided endonuclease Cas9 [Ekhidna sp.]|nr:type II CRISPR RNA-guided endonuclease Cas9 [Ekhidna sp.]
MKKILGLDLGTNSIGWALIEHDFDKKEGKIEGLGSRIIPMSQDVLGNFDAGQSISQTAERTKYRGVRRLYQRDNQRRERLHRVLNILGFLPDHYQQQIDFKRRLGQFKIGQEPKLNYKPSWNEEKKKNDFHFLFQHSFQEMVDELRKCQPQLFRKRKSGKESRVPYDWTIYYLRKKALSQKITKQELAWVILNFNQKRGYYQLRGEEEETPDKKVKTFEILQVDRLEDSGEKIKESNEKLYDVYFKNGWKYDKQIVKTDNWEGKTKEFIVTSTVDKSGETKRTFKKVDSEKDWIAIKKKTEQDVDVSGKQISVYIFDELLKNPHQKIRGKLIRTIERKYYKKELKAILSEQAKHHPEFRDKMLYQTCLGELYPKNEDHQKNIKNRDLKYLLIEDIIFYQRPLKSQKSTISDCQYENYIYKNKDGTVHKTLVKVAPKSHPFYQEFRLWQFIQNLRIYQKKGKENGRLKLDIPITENCFKTEEEWVELYEFLALKKEVNQKHLIDYLVKKGKVNKAEKDNYRWNYVEDKTYPAGEIKAQFLNRLSKVGGMTDAKSWLTKDREFDLWHIVYSVSDKQQFKKALKTFAQKHDLHIDSFVEVFKKFPPFKSEYGAYSVKALNKLLPLMRLGKYWSEDVIDPDTKDRIDKLLSGEFDERIKERVRKKTIQLNSVTDFRGLPVWLAGYIVYDRHSESKDTSKWESPEDIDAYLESFKQHSLRNPIVEQIVLETLRVVRDIWQYYGAGKKDFFSEIHLELGREMKNPADKRRQISEKVSENEKTNYRIKQILTELMNDGIEVRPHSSSHQEILKIYEEGVYENSPEDYKKVKLDDINKIRKNNELSKKEIERYKLWLEQGYLSPYTRKTIALSDLFGERYQIEHIIPKSRYFDDSLSNKVICESAVNDEKDNQTAYEFIKNKAGSIIDLGQGEGVKVLSLDDYENHCTKYFSGNKLKNLLSEEVPEGFINRQMNDSRYISKFIKGLLTNIVKEEDEQEATSKNLMPVAGAITDRLKKDWGLNDQWNELIAPRFKRLNELTKSNDFGYWDEEINAFRCKVPDEVAKGFSKKRIDHRHHAMDALVIACTTKDHINYITSINTERKNYSLVSKLRNQKEITTVKGEKRTIATSYKLPWEHFTTQAKEALETTVVSFKQNLRVINKTSNKTWQWEKKNGQWEKKLVAQTKGDSWAIRKPLHRDFVFGKVDISWSNDKNTLAIRRPLDSKIDIMKVTDTGIQKILSNYLEFKNGNKEEAFSHQGIEELNQNIKNFNNGKSHQPIHKVRTYESSSRFPISEEESNPKSKKYVEAAKGTNLFFAIYWNEEKERREYETIPLHRVIEHQKQEAHLPKAQCTHIPTDHEKGIFLFSLSPNDLVYVPTDEELDDPDLVDFDNPTKEQAGRVYLFKDSSKKTANFIPAYAAITIFNVTKKEQKKKKMKFSIQNEFGLGSQHSKNQKTIDGLQIKDRCWKIDVDRLGNIQNKIIIKN